MGRSHAEPRSPCTNVCRLNDAQVCVGCGRYIDEIIDWAGASERRKHEIIAAARRRLSNLNSLKGNPR